MPTYSTELVVAVQKLREERPRWGKDKLVVLLHREGLTCSTSMVGRIITRLKARGMLKEPIRNHVSAQRKGISRPYGIRKPKDYPVNQPGDLRLRKSLSSTGNKNQGGRSCVARY